MRDHRPQTTDHRPFRQPRSFSAFSAFSAVKSLRLPLLLISAFCFLLSAFSSASPLPTVLRWDHTTHTPRSQRIELTRGGYYYIEPQYLTYADAAVTLSNVTAVAMRYRSADMAASNTYYIADGEVLDAADGRVRITWTPTNEATADLYSYNLVLSYTNALGVTLADLTCAGMLRLRGSISTGVDAPTPRTDIDWSIVENTNTADAPFLIKTGAVVSVFGRTGAVTAQSGDYTLSQITGLETALDGKASTSTVSQVAADVLSISGRVDTVESWGDHGTNGYLTAFVELDPVFGLWLLTPTLPYTAITNAPWLSDFSTLTQADIGAAGGLTNAAAFDAAGSAAAVSNALGTAAFTDATAYETAGAAGTLSNALGTAAFTDSTAYDSAGSASTLSNALGTAAFAATGDFDAAGSASTLSNALGTAAFTDASAYATGTPVYVESDPVWLSEKSGYATGTPVYVESDPVWLSEKSGYATGTPVYVESDPLSVRTDGSVPMTGALASGYTASFTTGGPTDNLDVSAKNTIFVSTLINNVTIGGLSGGVAGQVLRIVHASPVKTLTLEHDEGGASQNIYLTSSADESLTSGQYGGWTLMCNGTYWVEVNDFRGLAGGAAGSTNAITSSGLVDISALLGGAVQSTDATYTQTVALAAGAVQSSYFAARADLSTTAALTWTPTTWSAKWAPATNATFAMAAATTYPRGTFSLWHYPSVPSYTTITFNAQIDVQNTITPTGTNLWIISPGDTVTNWLAVGRAF